MGVARSVLVAAFALVALLVLPTEASAERTRVDWQRGLLIGRGIAVGDLRSPTRQLARVKAERQARARCRELLLKEARGVAQAKGKTIVRQSSSAEDLASLGDSIFVLHADYGTDGSVVVEMALPLDTLRTFANGPDQLLPIPVEGPTAVVVDARDIGLEPAVGYTVSDGATSYLGPTLFFTSEADARKHVSIGAKAPLVRAKATTKKNRRTGTIALASGTLGPLVVARPLVAVLWKPGR